MADLQVERLDHLGIIAGVIKDLGIIPMIDARLRPDAQEAITPGEAVAGMILNGLGFSRRPLSLTPQFFHHKPLDLLMRPGVEAEHFNRFKLGRTLDELFRYGCDLLFGEVAAAVCRQEGVDQRFVHLDTTTFSVTGDYCPDSDEQAIRLLYGYSKDHRPDLKQAVLELMVSQDGGVPLISQSWDGNAADNAIFQQRTKALVEQFKAAPGPAFVVADSKLYTQANAANLRALPFITRIPATLQVTEQRIAQALESDIWQVMDATTRFQEVALCHYGIAQRWIIVYSESARQRARQSLHQACQREAAQIDRQVRQLRRRRFATPRQVYQALQEQAQSWRYHRLRYTTFTPHRHYAGRGRPTAHTPVQAREWQIDQVQVLVEQEQLDQLEQQQACFVLGTPLLAEEKALSPQAVIQAYKAQSKVEGGFRFLKDPLFFASSLFVKKPQRLQALMTVMTLSLLVYSVAQRRLRQQLEKQQQTLPNQIGQPTATPTLRWIFQQLEGINRVTLTLQGHSQVFIDGLTDLRRKILHLFGPTVCQIYCLTSFEVAQGLENTS